MTIDRKLYNGVMVHVLGGDTYAHTDFILTSPDPIDVGTDDITFEIHHTQGATSDGAPTTTPLHIGQFNVDVTTPAAYIAVGTSASSDWKRIDNTS